MGLTDPVALVVACTVALLAHRQAAAQQQQLLKATLWGIAAYGVAALRNVLSRSVLGLPREPAPVEEWAAQAEEDAVDPELAIVDAHHHLFDMMKNDLGIPRWLLKLGWAYLKPQITEKLVTRMAPTLPYNFGWRLVHAMERYMGPELLRDIRGPGSGRGHRVVGTVFMEFWWNARGVEAGMEHAGEVDMVTEVHRQHPELCGGIVAKANLSLGAEVEPVLKHYKQNPLVKGVRFGFAWSQDPAVFDCDDTSQGMAYDPKFREGFALLSKYGFSFDSWLYHENLEGFIDLARTFPDTTMICDHQGFPLGLGSYKRDETLPIWKERMTRLAEHKNVYVKIGGFGMRFMGFGFDERAKPATSDELAEAWRPYIIFVIETFGVERCIMESNFPMDKITCSYTTYFNALKKAVSGYSNDDKRRMFELNAKRIYRLE